MGLPELFSCYRTPDKSSKCRFFWGKRRPYLRFELHPQENSSRPICSLSSFRGSVVKIFLAVKLGTREMLTNRQLKETRRQITSAGILVLYNGHYVSLSIQAGVSPDV